LGETGERGKEKTHDSLGRKRVQTKNAGKKQGGPASRRGTIRISLVNPDIKKREKKNHKGRKHLHNLRKVM